MDPFLGQINLFGCNYAPVNWALAEGQILSIAQNTALFSLLGTNFGGNGINTFALPDLRGRVPIGFGQGPGLSNYALGEAGGVEAVQITAASYPAHSHSLMASAAAATQNAPDDLLEAEGQTGGRGGALNLALYSSSGQATTLAPNALSSVTGGNQPHNNLQPYLPLNFCIALQGIFPSRS